jgi:hypothetical protein
MQQEVPFAKTSLHVVDDPNDVLDHVDCAVAEPPGVAMCI